MNGYHFLRADKCLGYDDHRIVRVGETITVTCKPVMCHSGLHASKRAIDTLNYAPGPIACRVELGGDLIHADDKSVGTTRKCLAMIDATRVLHEFACRCAEDALALVANPDSRSVEGIRAKRKWLAGYSTDQELAAAHDAARAAEWDAARAAARNAAWAAARAAARDAAWDAARDAARAAEWDAAHDAARAAEWDAAHDAARAAELAAAQDATRDAAWAAARAAARDKQNRRLIAMLASAVLKAEKS